MYTLKLGVLTSATPDTKNHWKKNPLDVAEKSVETYPHLVQQHNTLRKGLTNLVALLITKKNHWSEWYFTGNYNNYKKENGQT